METENGGFAQKRRDIVERYAAWLDMAELSRDKDKDKNKCKSGTQGRSWYSLHDGGAMTTKKTGLAAQAEEGSNIMGGGGGARARGDSIKKSNGPDGWFRKRAQDGKVERRRGKQEEKQKVRPRHEDDAAMRRGCDVMAT